MSGTDACPSSPKFSLHQQIFSVLLLVIFLAFIAPVGFYNPYFYLKCNWSHFICINNLAPSLVLNVVSPQLLSLLPYVIKFYSSLKRFGPNFVYVDFQMVLCEDIHIFLFKKIFLVASLKISMLSLEVKCWNTSKISHQIITLS